MLPRRYIEEWKEFAPWPEDAQVVFDGDIYGLLRPGIEYDQNKAYELIKSELIEKI